jgi:hypothetical protein
VLPFEEPHKLIQFRYRASFYLIVVIENLLNLSELIGSEDARKQGLLASKRI